MVAGEQEWGEGVTMNESSGGVSLGVGGAVLYPDRGGGYTNVCMC